MESPLSLTPLTPLSPERGHRRKEATEREGGRERTARSEGEAFPLPLLTSTRAP